MKFDIRDVSTSLLQSVSRYCLMHIVDRFANEMWFSCNYVNVFSTLSEFIVKRHARLSEQMQLASFLFLQRVQKH